MIELKIMKFIYLSIINEVPLLEVYSVEIVSGHRLDSIAKRLSEGIVLTGCRPGSSTGRTLVI